MARRFRDATAREWVIRITCNTLRKYEDETGICMMLGKDPFGGKIGNLIRLAYLACEREAVKLGIVFEDFAEALQTKEQLEDLGNAVKGAMEDFTQGQGPSISPRPEASRGPGKTSTN